MLCQSACSSDWRLRLDVQLQTVEELQFKRATQDGAYNGEYLGDEPAPNIRCNMIRSAFITCPCRLPLSSRVIARTPRTYRTGVSAMSKQDKAAEIIRDAVDAKVWQES